jgi:hypothetical protein
MSPSPLELTLCPLLILNKSPFVFFCAEVINHFTIRGLLTIFLDDSSYHDLPSPNIDTVFNTLGTCSWLFIQTQWASPFI